MTAGASGGRDPGHKAEDDGVVASATRRSPRETKPWKAPGQVAQSTGNSTMMISQSLRTLVVLSTWAAISVWGANGALAQDTYCYDAEISARIVSQTPTVMPDCADCIVTSWPWIVDLDVRRVHSGEVRRGRLSVLTVQSTYLRRDIGTVRWKLRRNTQGGFNVVWFGDDPERQCSPGEPFDSAYLTPPDGMTLDDLRSEGREQFGRDN